MDKYIIDNMPEDDETPVDSHVTLVGDMGTQKIVLDLVDEGQGFEIVGSVVDADADLDAATNAGATLVAFDPRMGLPSVLSVLFTIRHADLRGVSSEATAILGAILSGGDL